MKRIRGKKREGERKREREARTNHWIDDHTLHARFARFGDGGYWLRDDQRVLEHVALLAAWNAWWQMITFTLV